MTPMQTALVYWAKYIANDNRYTYGSYPNNLGPWTYDCCTYNSLTIYKAMGWNDFPNPAHGGIGYFWNDPSDEVYGAYDFLYANGWTKHNYNASLLTEGAIIICEQDVWHSIMYLGNNELADANPNHSSDDQIAVRQFPTYDPSDFRIIFLPPDVTPAPIGQPNGIGTALTHDEVTQYYNAISSDWTLADLKNWVQSQPFYSWINDELFYLMMGWCEGEDYFTQSLEGSYLCGCCGINNSYHQGATDYASFKAAMYLPNVSYYSYANMMSRGQNASAPCVKIMTLAFANPNTEASLFYGEYAGWIPPDYIPYSPLCYDQGIQIWCIPERGWTLTITGTGVRDWTPTPTPPQKKKTKWIYYLPFRYYF